MFRALLAQFLVALVVALTSGAAPTVASALSMTQVTSPPWVPARPVLPTAPPILVIRREAARS